MIKHLNKIRDNDFVASMVIVVLIVIAIGGYAGIKAIQNHNRAVACATQGGTAYGHDNWLCVR